MIMYEMWKELRFGFRYLLRDLLLWVGFLCAAMGVAAVLGFLFRIFRWAAGL